MPPPQKPDSGQLQPQIERIRGGTQLRIVVTIIVGCILIILTIGFVILLAKNPQLANTSGTALLNIIVAAIFSLIGFVVGKKSNGHE
jgi:hypothetical protein